MTRSVSHVIRIPPFLELAELEKNRDCFHGGLPHFPKAVDRTTSNTAFVPLCRPDEQGYRLVSEESGDPKPLDHFPIVVGVEVVNDYVRIGSQVD